MIYKCLRLLVSIGLRVWFRRIFYSNESNIPANKPIILAANHPSSGMDGVVMAIVSKRPVYFLARSDIFNTPLKRWFLAQIHILPIYRLEEGFENLSKNEDTFAACFELLKQNGMVMIFPEGRNIHEKWLRPLKKGTVKLALQAVETLGIDLQLVPTGINYTYAERPRSEMMINFGEPIRVLNYLEVYQENKPKALTQLNRDLAVHLEKEVIIEARGTEEVVENLLIILRNETAAVSGWKIRDERRIRMEQSACQVIKRLKEEDITVFDALAKQTKTYFEALKQQNLTDETVVKQQSSHALRWFSFPLIWLGKTLNSPPLWYAKRIAKQKVKLIEFWATVLFVLGFVLYLIYGLLLVIIGFSINLWLGLGVFIGLPISYYLALRLQEITKPIGELTPEKMDLVAQRKQILAQFKTAQLDLHP